MSDYVTESNTSTLSKSRVYLVPGVLLMVGFILLYIRSMDPILNPVVYTEDGVWVALGLEKGWGYALINAKSIYFVFINIILLYFSSLISVLFAGNPLTYLPEGISIMSGLFYSATATLVFVTVRRFSTTWLGCLAFLLIVLLPMGTAQNTIIGRISQVGYFIPIIVVCLLFWRSVSSRYLSRVGLDALILLCACTNPIVLALVGAYICLLGLKTPNPKVLLRSTYTLIVPLCVLLFFLVPKMGGEYGIPKVFMIGHLVEAAVGRSVAYPFVFPWYGLLSDGLSLIFLLIFLLFVASAYIKADAFSKFFIQLVFVTLVIVDVATFVMRPGLTGLLSGYQVFALDQYFMGINALVVLLAVISIAQFLKPGDRRVPLFTLIVVVAIYIKGYSLVFEGANPKTVIRTDLNFREQLCTSEAVDPSTSVIDIYFRHPSLVMRVPSKYINKSHCAYTRLQDSGWMNSTFEVPDSIKSKEIDIVCASSIDAISGNSTGSALTETQRSLELGGWLAFSTKTGALFDRVLLTRTDEKGARTYISTSSQQRPDVAAVFKQPSLSGAGFKSLIDLAAMKGQYSLGLAGIKGSQLYVCNQYAIPLIIP